MNVCISYDDKFETLANLACSELTKSNNIIHMNKIINDKSYKDGFGSDTWYNSIRNKIEFSKKIFDSLENEQCVCVSDSDVYYINSQTIYDLESYMQINFLDFLFPLENLNDQSRGINSGFFIVKKSEYTINFFNDILSENFTNFRYADQDIINNYLKQALVKYDFLDPKCYVMACYMHSIADYIKENLVLLHATCANNFWEKIGQIVSFNSKFKLPLIKWLDNSIDNTKVKYYINGSIINA